MNATVLAQNAYGTSPTRTPRMIEYDIFSKATGGLSKAKTDTEKAAAIAKNRELWSLLAIDVSDANNGLPADLKARLFYLSQFVTAESRKALKGEVDMTTLIEINTTIMSALTRQKVAA